MDECYFLESSNINWIDFNDIKITSMNVRNMKAHKISYISLVICITNHIKITWMNATKIKALKNFSILLICITNATFLCLKKLNGYTLVDQPITYCVNKFLSFSNHASFCTICHFSASSISNRTQTRVLPKYIYC